MADPGSIKEIVNQVAMQVTTSVMMAFWRHRYRTTASHKFSWDMQGGYKLLHFELEVTNILETRP